MFYGDARRAVVCAVRPSGSTMTGGPRGYQVSAVSPNAKQVEGDPSYPNVKSVPGGIHAVVIGTRPALAGDTMRECVERASSRCGCIAARDGKRLPSCCRVRRAHGITIIDGGCPCMFDPTADLGHKAMCPVSAPTGKVPRQV